ncbi:hypothetical protein CC85DRAFT_282876 [Cutaneotrichosporon oleaginosum]|uniref:Uncharacterized protein n=1 Tax=Cutaneotrichosporon oleaginosum TaxID=879819 RepID=A0A0J0XV65_9TREE|nr:uncharacterized protein CC85DRAFT_282876 [Cutaneotrichosporon oleaginosum]KLT44955.1 hypothetical protein CC85DRAFT_282876 [Cutaneotrichosporon oleaginosum]TXT09644.1 hypothetical protein COLE_03578 [Cutaneotrichosporon oleaginosum]
MLFTSLLTTALAATAVRAAGAASNALELMNTTAAGSQITWPTADTTIPLNGTVYVKWDWKEESSPKLMVLLTNKNTTVFHAAGHAPDATTGLGGKGLYDTKESVLANETSVSFGPMKPPGDTGIKAGPGYRVVLGWQNNGADAQTKPYMFLASPEFTVGPKGAQQLPEGVKPWDAKPASAVRASAPVVMGAVVAIAIAAIV